MTLLIDITLGIALYLTLAVTLGRYLHWHRRRYTRRAP